ncbi:MAG TPA: hypothetical protein VEL02_08575 [Jatrophihabitantaceae bacterium]|nr:hypothetical protein [Jatrophihabitantaceae bacterium]
MSDWVDFVEVVPDATTPRLDYEQLTSQPARRRRPAWLDRASDRRGWYAAAAVMLLGCLLAADGAVRDSVERRPPAPAARAYHVGDRCPADVKCEHQGHARQDMWSAYDQSFPGTTMVGSDLWNELASGVVFYQQLEATSLPDAAIRITLSEQRLDGPSVSFGPTFDIMPRHGTPPQRRRTVLVTAMRGPWLISAVVSGPWERSLPVDDALHWAAIAPLPD